MLFRLEHFLIPFLANVTSNPSTIALPLYKPLYVLYFLHGMHWTSLFWINSVAMKFFREEDFYKISIVGYPNLTGPSAAWG